MTDTSAKSIHLSCTCGKVTGSLRSMSRRAGTHMKCLCPDCRAGELYLDQPDPGRTGGVDLFQTTPDLLHIETGTEHLGVFRFSPKGVMRWYATCCRAPLFNTVSQPKFAFVGVHTARLDDLSALGPVTGRAFVPQADGRRKHENGTAFTWQLLSRAAAGFLSGRWRQTPLFDPESGNPVVTPQILSKEERARHYPDGRS